MFSFVVRVCVQNRLFGPCVHAELQRCRAYASSQGSDSCLVAKGERERERQSFLSLSLSPEALQAVTVRAEGLNVTLKSLILTDVNQLCRQRERGSSLLLSLVSALGNIARCALRRTWHQPCQEIGGSSEKVEGAHDLDRSHHASSAVLPASANASNSINFCLWLDHWVLHLAEACNCMQVWSCCECDLEGADPSMSSTPRRSLQLHASLELLWMWSCLQPIWSVSTRRSNCTFLKRMRRSFFNEFYKGNP